jgi:hypothetical protein
MVRKLAIAVAHTAWEHEIMAAFSRCLPPA